jgi:ABC-2 type transport system ATP-binding protein
MIATLENFKISEPLRSVRIVASLERVNKSYGNVHALLDLDFQVHSGEIVALLGPNGAGKTTAVKLLLGLMQPNSGKVRVFGGDPVNPENRMRTGAMLQVGRVPETLRVREHIELFSSYYRQPLPSSEVLAAAGLEKLSDRKFGELSGGRFAGIPTSSSSMSPPSVWTWKHAACCGRKFVNWCGAGKPFCSPPITCKRRTLWPIALP